ncbi:MAG: hypothetical protein GY786_18635 [Proteobacteria bacterium]|nr:hypothetical protein [Pseudomonadota bacterium]
MSSFFVAMGKEATIASRGQECLTEVGHFDLLLVEVAGTVFNNFIL